MKDPAVCMLCYEKIPDTAKCTRMTFDETLGVCPQCEADARLGRMVRRMPVDKMLHSRWTELKGGWSVSEWWQGEPRSVASGDTPEEALEKVKP
jgi:hypothetical protein